MKKVFRILLQSTLRPFLEHYWLKSTRKSSFAGIKIEVPPSVFHPGLYFSSRLMAHFISSLDLKEKTVLDVGSGSGILGLVASKEGAKVTAIDINPVSVGVTIRNAERNDLSLEVIQSDLFANVKTKYDFVFINPPYFPRDPKEHSEHAWYCGIDFTYFHQLFQTIHLVLSDNARTFMVLSDACDVKSITSIAHTYGYEFLMLKKGNYIFEKNYIFEICATEH